MPQGVTGPGRPTGLLPSPPPWGWSQGFMTEPRLPGADAHVALAAGLAEVDVLVVDVGDLTDDCGAVHGHVAHLTGGQTDQSVAILLSHQLRHNASGTDQLAALAGIQLDVVDHGTNGDVLEGRQLPGLISAAAEETTLSPGGPDPRER